MTAERNTATFTEQLRSTVERCRAELGETGRSLEEIELLLAQTAAEVERLSQREIQLSTRLRDVELNLEAYPRSEIRDAYRAVHEATLRLFMLRNQMEQLTERRESLLRYQERLRELVNLAESQLQAAVDRERQAERRTRLLSALPETLPIDEMLAAIERERARIRRSLEHELAQILGAIILETEVCLQLERQRPQDLRIELVRLRELASEAVRGLRRTLLELAPSLIQEIGLVATLRRYGQELARLRNLEQFEVSGPDRDDQLPPMLALLIYRTVQEILHTIVQTEGITHIRLTLRYEPAQVVARLEGSGPAPLDPLPHFDPETLARLERLGASLSTELLTPEQVRLTLLVPLT